MQSNINRIKVEFKAQPVTYGRSDGDNINRIKVEFKEDTRYTPGSYALRY